MPRNGNVKYILQDYDYVLVVASWGKPKEYRASKYVLEVEKISDSGKKRTTISDDRIYHSSTAAIRDLLWKKINISQAKINLIIFCQDTILIDYIIKSIFGRSERDKEKKRSNLKRSNLKKRLLQELYYQNPDVAKELDVNKFSTYKNFVRFVPGVITSVRGSYLYTLRTNSCYDLLVGSIILYTFEKLKEFPRDARRIAILIDTTHGINYFATALKEGVLKAVALYAFNRFTDSLTNGDSKALEELIVYHYNSDPLTPESQGTPSLKVHLLDKISIVKGEQILLNSILATIEEQMVREGLETLSVKLSQIWGDIKWKSVLWPLLLLTRGLLIWALKAAHDIDNIPSIDDFDESLNNLKLKFSSKKKNMLTINTIDYHLSDKTPIAQVVEYSILANTLKHLANKVACASDVSLKGFNLLKSLSKALKDELSGIKLYDEVMSIINNKGSYKCFDLEKIRKVAKQVYTLPFSDIIHYEIESLKNYLTGKENVRWNKISNHVYVEYRTRLAYMIQYNDMHTVISLPRGSHKRAVYAHAGLAYGLPWFALALKEKSTVVLYLGNLGNFSYLL